MELWSRLEAGTELELKIFLQAQRTGLAVLGGIGSRLDALLTPIYKHSSGLLG